MAAVTPGATLLLQAIQRGDPRAAEQLLPLVYAELRKLAAQRLGREKPGQTLQATALVHEAYLRLVDQKSVNWQNRAQFLGVAAQLMRRILVDAARERCAVKRGAGAQRVTLDKVLLVTPERDDELVALEEALRRLEHIDPRKARVVELRFFVGLNVEEIAGVLKLSQQSILRDWKLARAWLTRELNRADVPASVAPLGN